MSDKRPSDARSLSLQSCWPQPGRVLLFENRTKLAELRQTLSGVTELTLAHIQHPSDVIFQWVMESMPSLCSILLLGCNVFLVPYHEFNNGNQWLPNPRLLSLHFISQEISKRKVSLLEVDCNLTGIDDIGMSELVAVGHDLQLERLILGNSKELSWENLSPGTAMAASGVSGGHDGQEIRANYSQAAACLSLESVAGPEVQEVRQIVFGNQPRRRCWSPNPAVETVLQ
uniref:Uncharacterized protein n=1 Tax=Anopheles atroparvus TaxID=41427 RepID=A0A182IZ22_ANOAO